MTFFTGIGPDEPQVMLRGAGRGLTLTAVTDVAKAAKLPSTRENFMTRRWWMRSEAKVREQRPGFLSRRQPNMQIVALPIAYWNAQIGKLGLTTSPASLAELKEVELVSKKGCILWALWKPRSMHVCGVRMCICDSRSRARSMDAS